MIQASEDSSSNNNVAALSVEDATTTLDNGGRRRTGGGGQTITSTVTTTSTSMDDGSISVPLHDVVDNSSINEQQHQHGGGANSSVSTSSAGGGGIGGGWSCAKSKNNSSSGDGGYTITSRTTTTEALSAAEISLNSDCLRNNISSSRRRRQDGGGADNIENEASQTLIMSSHERHRKKLIRKSTEGFSINKLNLSNLGLVGRDTEIAILQDSLQRVSGSISASSGAAGNSSTTTHSNREVVLIKGSSGTGKSVLVSNAIKQKLYSTTTAQTTSGGGGGAYCIGKFDLHLKDTPYIGISAFCRELVGLLLMEKVLKTESERHRQEQQDQQHQDQQQQQEDPDQSSTNATATATTTTTTALSTTTTNTTIGNELIEYLGEELLSLLIDAVPELEDLVSPFATSTTAASSSAAAAAAAGINEGTRNKQQLHHAFRLFVRYVASKYKPLVIVLDDLQWADMASLEVMDVLITDQDNHYGLLMVGCYRPVQVPAVPVPVPVVSSSSNARQEGGDRIQHQVDDSESSSSSNQLLSKFIRDLKEKSSNMNNNKSKDQNSQAHNIIEIELGNLSLEQTNQVICKLLSVSSFYDEGDKEDNNNIDNADRSSQQKKIRRQQSSNIQQLALLCHRRTKGNPFFLVSFLFLLYREEYIQFNLGSLQWNFDVPTIEKETASTINVVEMVIQKLNSMNDGDPNLARLLQIASLLGSRFDNKILFLIWKELYYDVKGEGQKRQTEEENEEVVVVFDESILILKQCLDQAIEQSFFEEVGSNKYQWVHDSLSEAALSLIPKSDQPSFKFKVGMILYHNLNRQELDSFIFVIVNLLNSHNKDNCLLEGHCGITDMEIAKLCAKAARKAKHLSAFGSTAKYARIGIDQITTNDTKKNNNIWTTNYDLALELYCAAAESECVLEGETDSNVQVFADEVLNHGLNILDKVPVYYVLALALGKMGQFADANKICVDAINQLEVLKIPRNGLILASRTIPGLLSTKNLLTSKTAGSFPFMSDPNQIATMKLLDLLTSYAFQANNIMLLLFATVQMVRLSIKHGISSSSPSAFASYGYLCSGVLNNLKAGVHIGEMTLAMVKRLKGQANESLVIARTWGFMLGYSRPVHDALKEFLHGYNEGMKFGDTEMASWCLFNHAACSLFAGKSLRTVEEDCRIYVAHIRDLGWNIVAEATSFILLAVVYLIGNEDEDSFSDLFAPMNGEPKFSDNTRFMCRSVAYAYTGNYGEGAEYAITIGNAVQKAAPGHSILQSDVFTRGVCLYAMARETNKKKYKKPARTIRKIIKTWVDQGSVNLKHHICLLNAEEEAIRGRNMDKASKLYREGIVNAARRGCLRDVGLMHERYANFLLHDLGDQHQARHHAQQSILLYEEWGALRTGERLKSKYSDLLKEQVPPSVKMSMEDDPPSALGTIGKSLEFFAS